MKDLNTLLEEYPEFFKMEERTTGDGPKMPFVLFGFECDDGWYVILKRLFSSIKWNVENNDYPMIIIDQIKEKFGGLRFYFEFIPFDEHKWKKSREDWDTETKDTWLADHANQIHGAVDFAESLSYHICERCGSTEDVTCEGPGWIITRCKVCRDKTERNKEIKNETD